MKKKLTMLMFTFILLGTAGFAFGAEMAKEGSGTGIIYYTSTSQVHAQGKENFVVNYDARGVSATDDETSPFYMSTDQCIGSLKAIKGEFKDSGLCTFTRPDDDKIYLSYEAAGKLGTPVKGTYTLVGGTGKCTGMTGSGEFTRTPLKGPAKGIGASVSKSTGSWKIP
jgi:hypothetical protein